MTTDRREQLESLLSEWLDDPARDDLRARIDALVGDDAELIASRRAWLLLHAAFLQSPRVNWTLQRERILAALPAAPRSVEDLDSRLDAALQVTGATAPVDWQKMKSGVMDAVAAQSDAPRVVRFPVWRRRVAGLAVAAAAALAVWLAPWHLLSPTTPVAPHSSGSSVAVVRISTIATREFGASEGDAVAKIHVVALADSAAMAKPAIVPSDDDYFMIDPLVSAATAGTSAEYGMF